MWTSGRLGARTSGVIAVLRENEAGAARSQRAATALGS